MFEIVEKKGQIIIRLTAGDSAEIETQPFIDSNANKVFDSNLVDNNYFKDEKIDYAILKDDKPIILGDADYVLFCVASPSGRVYLKKLLTNNDYNSNGVLTMKLSPADTIDLQPFSYLFSFSYMPNKGEDCYTYATGIFNLLPAFGTIRELNKPDLPIDPEQPIVPDDTDNSSESGDVDGS